MNPSYSLAMSASAGRSDVRPQVPSFAARTEEILLELGLDWDRIIALKSAGAVTWPRVPGHFDWCLGPGAI